MTLSGGVRLQTDHTCGAHTPVLEKVARQTEISGSGQQHRVRPNIVSVTIFVFFPFPNFPIQPRI